MSALLPCPFCGGEDLEIDHAPTYDVHHPDVYEVHCVECSGGGGEGWTEHEAISAWNTRAERTCECVAEYAKSPIDGKTIVLHRCSACRNLMRPHMDYCPNCGAKVVGK